MAKRNYTLKHDSKNGRFIAIHGAYFSPEHRIWRGMLGRCRNKNNRSYPRYGGRGIVVCDRWLIFANFLADMGPRPKAMSIDRIDNDGPYSPDNCRWATPKMQSNNTGMTYLIEFRGEVKGISEWSRILGLGRTTIQARIAKGWSHEKALTTHVKARPMPPIAGK